MPKALRLLPVACAALALCAGTAAHGQDAALIPTTDLFKVFVENCADLREDRTPLETLTRNGWSEVSVAGHEGLSAFTSLHSEREGHRLEAEAFANARYPDIFVMVSKTRAAGAYVLDCHAVTFSPTADFTDADLAGLTSDYSSAEVVDNEYVHGIKWSPGLFAGHGETSISFLPANSEVRDRMPAPAPFTMLLGRSPSRLDVDAMVNDIISEERTE